MSTSATMLQTAAATRVNVTADTLSVELCDGRMIAVPIAWFPRLSYATTTERRKWRLIGRGHGIHWPDLDEDISVEGLLVGYPSNESQASLQRWLDRRKNGKAIRPSRTRRKK